MPSVSVKLPRISGKDIFQKTFSGRPRTFIAVTERFPNLRTAQKDQGTPRTVLGAALKNLLAFAVNIIPSARSLFECQCGVTYTGFTELIIPDTQLTIIDVIRCSRRLLKCSSKLVFPEKKKSLLH